MLTKAVDGVGAPTEAAGPRALSAKQRTARLGAKTHSRSRPALPPVPLGAAKRRTF